MSASRAPPRACAASHVGFTPHQLEVLLVTECLRQPQSADRISTTPKTVAPHVAAILTKLHARSRVARSASQTRQGRSPRAPHPLHGTSESNIGGRLLPT